MDKRGAPADASTMIYLAKADLFREASGCIGAIHVPPAVWAETVDAGERLGRSDAVGIRRAEQAGWLRRITLERAALNAADRISTHYRLGRGESEVLAVLSRGMEAMIDDRRATRVAATLGIRPIRTLMLPGLGCIRGCWSPAIGLEMLRVLSVIVAVRADALAALEEKMRRRR